tara:strand:- start:5671 stop:6774 length:1104 start_codon:yes stop_codon:yes gene_type:complete
MEYECIAKDLIASQPDFLEELETGFGVRVIVDGWRGYFDMYGLEQELSACGIPAALHPKRVSQSTALKRAMDHAREDKKTDKVVTLSRQQLYDIARAENLDSSRMKCGYSITQTVPEGQDLRSQAREMLGEEVEATSYLLESVSKGAASKATLTVIAIQKADDELELQFTPTDSIVRPYIEQKFAFYKGHFKASLDISQWFTQTIIPVVSGTATHAKGGTYFVPKGQGIDTLLRVQNAVHTMSRYKTQTISLGPDSHPIIINRTEVGGHISICPEQPQLASIGCAVSSLLNEVDKETTLLNEAVRDESLGQRAFETRAQRAANLEAKITAYEEAFKADLSDLKQVAEELQIVLGAAAAKAATRTSKK